MRKRHEHHYALKMLVIALFISFCGFSSASAESIYSQAPSDLPSYRSLIQSSLVKISCTGYTTLGIVEKVGTGVSNRIVAPAKAIVNCPKVRNGSGFTVTNLTSNVSVPGNLSQVGNGLTAEYSWLIGNAGAVPKILNERKGPILDQWLSVASISLGATSITWFTSSIKSIDLSTSTIVIDNPTLNIPNAGLVFDSRGTFLGLVSSTNQGNPVTLNVAGSPLRCKNTSETKIYSEVCLSSENDAIERLSLWPDNSRVGRGNTARTGRSLPNPTDSANPFRIKGDTSSSNRPVPSTRPATPGTSVSPSPTPTVVRCVKGREIIPATGTPPTCPAGYRKR